MTDIFNTLSAEESAQVIADNGNQAESDTAAQSGLAQDDTPQLPESRMPQYKGWQSKAAQFITAQTVSLFGSAIVRYAIMWSIIIATSSGLMMTLITLCAFLPQMLISVFAGAWADRYSRKTLIIISDSFIALSSLSLALYFILGGSHIWMMFLVTGLSSFGTGIQTPAVSALIPQIVPKDRLVQVNSIMSGLQSITMLLAPALSAVVIANFDLYVAFGIDVFTALTAVTITLLLKIKPHIRAKSDQHIFKEMLDGIRYIGSHKYLKNLMILMSVMLLLFTPAAMLTTLQVTRTYGDNVFYLSVIEITFSAGMLIGGILMGVTGGFKNRLHSITLAFIGFSLFTVLLGVAGVIPLSFYVYAAFMLLIGLVFPSLNIAFTTLLQEHVEPDMMGRVFGFITIINTSIMPLAMLGYGPLADYIRIEWILIATGALQIFILPFIKTVKLPQRKTVNASQPSEPE